MQNTIKSEINRILNQDIFNLNFNLQNLLVDEYDIYITFSYKSAKQDIADALQEKINTTLQNIYPSFKIWINFAKNFQPPSFHNKKSIQNAKNIIVIASGKGGVGKSTIAINLAYGLQIMGKKVALLDGDIYGPSLNFMLQGQKVDSQDINYVLPYREKDGIIYNSVANFVPQDKDAILLKAPMVNKLFNQLIEQTNWQNCDYLIIDTPPGTGDLHINLSLNFDIKGAIIVCTPQKLALLDAIKAINMYKKNNVNILGMIENMSTFTCPKCGEVSNIFDNNGAYTISSTEQIEFLGAIPINLNLRIAGDSADNLIKDSKEPVIASIFKDIAKKIIHKIE